MSGAMSERVRAVLPGATTVAAVNGVDLLPAVAAGTEVAMCDTGFNRAVVGGLRHAVAMGADRVVRMDTEEHPVELLPEALDALEGADVVVLDLAFDGSTLRPGSADEYHNLHVLPELLDSFTGHAMTLTGAHGYMAFRGEALARLLPFVEAALALAEDDAARAHRPSVRWAADTAFPVCAGRLGMRVRVLVHPAVQLRDRDGEKCAVQTRDTLSMVRALDTLLPAEGLT